MTDIKKFEKLKTILSKSDLDFVITRVAGAVVHVNVWIGEDDDGSKKTTKA